MNHLEISTKKKLTLKVKQILRRVCRPLQSIVSDSIKNRFPYFGTVSLQISNRLRIQFYTHGPHGTDRIALKLARYGLSGYEHETTRVLVPLVEMSKAVMDIGANTGCFAILAAVINPKCDVIAFEPVPFIFQMLEKNIKLNKLKNLKTNDLVISDIIGFSKFYLTRTRVGVPTDSSLRQGFRDQIEELNLTTTTVDNYVKANNLNLLDLLKIDVESSEDKVIRGALETIKRDRPFIICEVLDHIDHIYLQETLRALDYQFFHITLSGLKLHIDLQGSQGVNERNYLFVPKTRANQFFELCKKINITV